MRGASNKDTEKQYKYSSRHAPFKHASLARSSKSVSEQKGREMQEGKKKKKKTGERLQRDLGSACCFTCFELCVQTSRTRPSVRGRRERKQREHPSCVCSMSRLDLYKHSGCSAWCRQRNDKEEKTEVRSAVTSFPAAMSDKKNKKKTRVEVWAKNKGKSEDRGTESLF